jgi:predicted RND superfamily exporter protein
LDFSPTRNFGLLCALAMLTALLGNLLVLPRLLTRWAPASVPKAEDGGS